MVNNIRIITQKGGLLEQNLSGLFLLWSCLFKSPNLGLTVYLKFAHLINNKEYFWIKLSILFLSFCRVRYVVVASAFKWKFVYTHLIFWVTTVYFAFCLCHWNKRIKTEFSGISWIPNLLVMSLVAFLHFVPCTIKNISMQWILPPQSCCG